MRYGKRNNDLEGREEGREEVREEVREGGKGGGKREKGKRGMRE